MKAVLPLFIFIDACGWEIIRNDDFCVKMAANRRRLESVFGYSSACVPSIVSGNWPVDHRNWCYFVYDPPRSPFTSLKGLQWLPKAITSRRRVRRWLSKFVKAQMKFRGYFDLYNIPFRHISLFDFTEKKNPLQPNGMNRGPNIFDFLETSGIPYHVSDPTQSESHNFEAVVADVNAANIDFAFVYWPDLDGLMHHEGNSSPAISPKLRGYEGRIQWLLDVALEKYKEVRLYIFSDHGMANCDSLVDLKSGIEKLPLRFGKDYAAVYDSTMARFWFFNESARNAITAKLAQTPEGTILSDAELERLKCLFPDRYFGELIFLVKEGTLIVPSHMGERPIRAMHGYHPGEKHSYAALLSNQLDISPEINAIPHIYNLMVRDALIAHGRNAIGTGTPSLPAAIPFRQPQPEEEPAHAFAARVAVPATGHQEAA